MNIRAAQFFAAAALWLPLFAGYKACAEAAPPAAQAAIQSGYSQINAAFSQHDLDRFMTFFTPDYKVVDEKGTIYNKEQTRKQYAGQLKQMKTMQSRFTVGSFAATPAGVECEMKLHTQGTGEKRVLFMKFKGTYADDLWSRIRAKKTEKAESEKTEETRALTPSFFLSFPKPCQRFPSQQALGFCKAHLRFAVIAADGERLKTRPVFQRRQKRTGRVFRCCPRERLAFGGFRLPLVFRHRQKQPQGVDAHAPRTAGVLADILPQPLGEPVNMARIRRQVFVAEVAARAVCVVDRQAAGINRVGNAGLMRGVKRKIDSFDADIESVGV